MKKTTKDVDSNYVNPKKLKIELNRYKRTKKISNLLGEMFLLISKNMAHRPNFVGYTNNWRDEMIEQGVLHLCRYTRKFDSTKKNSNAFAYCSKIVYNAFIQYINSEKKYEAFKSNMLDAAYKKLGKSVYNNNDEDENY